MIRIKYWLLSSTIYVAQGIQRLLAYMFPYFRYLTLWPPPATLTSPRTTHPPSTTLIILFIFIYKIFINTFRDMIRRKTILPMTMNNRCDAVHWCVALQLKILITCLIIVTFLSYNYKVMVSLYLPELPGSMQNKKILNKIIKLEENHISFFLTVDIKNNNSST